MTYATPFNLTFWPISYFWAGSWASPELLNSLAGPRYAAACTRPVGFGVGQVLFQASIWTTLFFLAGMALNNWKRVAAAVVAVDLAGPRRMAVCASRVWAKTHGCRGNNLARRRRFADFTRRRCAGPGITAHGDRDSSRSNANGSRLTPRSLRRSSLRRRNLRGRVVARESNRHCAKRSSRHVVLRVEFPGDLITTSVMQRSSQVECLAKPKCNPTGRDVRRRYFGDGDAARTRWSDRAL